MKTYQLFLASVAAAVMFASCAKEPVFKEEVEGMIPISINSSIKQVHTKATAEGFVGGDAVGLYAVNYTDDNHTAGTLADEGNQADNVKYVFDEANHKWVPVKSVYYKNVNTNVDIYLYYPYQGDISDVDNANFEVKKDQSTEKTSAKLSGYEASDFLWGKGENITPVESAISIPMYHKLSAVNITLVEKGGFEEGEFENLEKSVILVNTTRKATINYATGEVTKLGEPQLDGIVMCPQDTSFRAIVIPQSVAAGTRLFSITIGGKTYGFKDPDGKITEYQTGKQLNYRINITKKSDSGEFELSLVSLQISDWTEDKNTHGGEARQYYVVNVETPGTLGATIKVAGKNPGKIRNLKISGRINEKDFSFMKDSMAILEAINMKEAVLDARGRLLADAYKNTSSYETFIAMYGEPNEISGNKCSWYEKGEIIPPSAFTGKKTLCYFVFPEIVTSIGNYAFSGTNLTGALIIPEDVYEIGEYAFYGTEISSLSLGSKLTYLYDYAFKECTTLSGNLLLPDSLTWIGQGVFSNCSFSGKLHLPENLTQIQGSAFYRAGSFSGGLKLPDKIVSLQSGGEFSHTSFTGSLDLNNCVNFSASSFPYCNFSGELIIPEGTVEISEGCFLDNRFVKVIFPKSLKNINANAFSGNSCLEEVEIQEGLISIGQGAFSECRHLISLSLPSTLQSIKSNAFSNCYYISNITCKAIEPPIVFSGAFNGVAKDNFALQVPEQSIVRYETETGWSDFKRVSAHYDFSIGRTRMRTLNVGMERTYTLRCPANYDWSISKLPDFVSVSPDHGTGKTDVTITVDAMPRTENIFEVNEGSFIYPSYKNYKGRSDTLIFRLNDKDYTCKVNIEQYDYDYTDGKSIANQTKTIGEGIDIVFIGEGYDAKDIASGKFIADCQNGYNHFFNIEPYKTYKDYFNVYFVISQSDESGIETVNTIIANKFMKNGVRDVNAALKWAKKASSNIDISKTVVILLDNSSDYYGWTYMYDDGSAMSVVPISAESYPYDYRGLIQHEAGGHAFGKLADEYIYHNAYIQTCSCTDGCDHPSSFDAYHSKGWYKNVSMNSLSKLVPWSHLIYDSRYSNRVDMYEGAYMHRRGVYRSEITSCMNNNIPYFNSISRQAIVERIMDYSGGTFDFDTFVSKDNFDVGTKSMADFDWTFGVDPNWNRGTEKGSIIYMGDHPDVD